MKVLLKEDVETLGYAGEVHEVAPGYGRNYLIPRGLAEKATPSTLKAAESWRKRAEARRAQIRKEHEALVQRINEVTLNFTAKAGEQGKLYGSITTAAIADELNETLGIDLDRRKIESAPLRQVGEHQVTVVLSRDYRAHLKVNIHPESEEEGQEDVTPVAEASAVAEEIDAEADYEWESEWDDVAADEVQ